MAGDPEDIGFAGVVGICSEAVKILRSYTRHFLSMAGTLVLPLGVVLLSQSFVSDPLLRKLTQMGRNNQRLDAEFVGLYLIAVLYLVFVLALSLFATAAIVYSVACIYTGKGLSYMKVIRVVPNVWSRLIHTFLWAHILLSFYYAAFVALLLALFLIQESTQVSMTMIMIPSIIVFNVFLVHFNLVWHLASVVSVLEDTKGVCAMKRSNALIAGKRLAGFYLFVIYASCILFMLGLFSGGLAKQNTSGRVFLTITLLVVWTTVTLLAIVIQSIFYFVCKSYHQERIDRSALAQKLDGYLGDYTPLSDPVSAGAPNGELEQI
ncbi:uncharacterized protein [Physcomitrium patens]|uniref:Uncharacterized protein n=1 Tax=Physcomitrium patens TaxID=3218 RepID=A9TK92_PHYPA|nr:uncharacterized protein LOC112285101 [Physcomitrium patens]PNR63058.1 hypothetical protein PHYPA_001483 [Physcomitrium patens]|eukprot:XP_024381444.1 uncharacterized protein LOC112285101 [Physcomitrella patens]